MYVARVHLPRLARHAELSRCVLAAQSTFGAKLRHHAKPLFFIFSIPVGCVRFERPACPCMPPAAAFTQTLGAI